MRDSFVFYKSFQDAIETLDDAGQLALYKAITAYSLNEEIINLDGAAKGMFMLIKPQIDANNRKYKNGCKGGRKQNQEETKTEPKQNQEETKTEPKQNQEETKTEPNDNVNDNENDNVNDNVNVSKTPEEYLKVFPEKLQDKLREWLNYKKQRKEKYTDIGLRNFFAQVWNRRKENSDDVIIELIGICMANNWKGIIWDKLADGKKRSNVNNAYQGEQPEYENLDNFYMT